MVEIRPVSQGLGIGRTLTAQEPRKLFGVMGIFCILIVAVETLFTFAETIDIPQKGEILS